MGARLVGLRTKESFLVLKYLQLAILNRAKLVALLFFKSSWFVHFSYLIVLVNSPLYSQPVLGLMFLT